MARERRLTLPNVITLVRLVALIPLFVILSVTERTTGAIVVLFLIGISDWADGWIARRFDLSSDLGRTLDPLADRLAMAAVVITLVVQGYADLWMVALIVLPDAILGGAALVLSAQRRFPAPQLEVTLLGKARTALLMTGLPLLLLASYTTGKGTVLWGIAYAITAAGCVGHALAAVHYGVLGRRALRVLEAQEDADAAASRRQSERPA